MNLIHSNGPGGSALGEARVTFIETSNEKNGFPVNRLKPSGTTSKSTDPERGQVLRLSEGAGQRASSPGFPRFSELPVELALIIWEMAPLDYKKQPWAFQIPNFPWPWDGRPEGEFQEASLVARDRRSHALRKVCYMSRRVFDAMRAGVPAAHFHHLPTILSHRTWRSFQEIPACFQGAADFGLFLNPYNIYATCHHSEAGRLRTCTKTSRPTPCMCL